jgi:acyl-CoA hydrolase
MDLVVTEYGVADVRRTDIDGRARALIGIAAPQFRDTLAEAWRQRRLAM